MRKELKAQIIEDLTARIKENPNFYVTNVEGLNAEATAKLRRNCFKQNIKMLVVKNTLFAKALEKSGVQDCEAFENVLKGSSAIMFAETPNGPARLIKSFSESDGKGKPVKGLQVMLVNSEIDTDNLPDSPYWEQQLKRISDTTDAEGNFDVRTSDRPWEKVRVMIRDIDGSKNGNFEKKIVDVDFGDPEPTGGSVSSWKLGVKKAEVTVKVERKK